MIPQEELAELRAEWILDQALAFLGTCAVTAAPLNPSETVDIGWHTSILYARDYAEFRNRVAGHFINHTPTAISVFARVIARLWRRLADNDPEATWRRPMVEATAM